jgi:hypothetical protein
MFQVHTPDGGSIFLSFSVYLDRSHSSFLFSFVFFFSSGFLSFFLLCFILLSFPRAFLFSSFYRRLPMHKSRQKEKSPEYQPTAQMAAKYEESKLGPPAPARISSKLPWKVCQFFRWKRVEQIHLLLTVTVYCLELQCRSVRRY